MLEKAHISGKIGDESYMKIQEAGNPGSLFCEPAGQPDDVGDFYAKGIYGEGGNKVGIMTIQIVNVEPGTLLHTMAMKAIVSNMKEKLRKEKLIGQGRR